MLALRSELVVADCLEQWISEHIRMWWEGTQPTTNELFEGHLLVYTLCTDGGTIGLEIQVLRAATAGLF